MNLRYRQLSFLFPLMLPCVLIACFNPDLGNYPYLCASSGKKCPDGYTCNKKNVCVPEELASGISAQDAQVPSDIDYSSKEGPIMLDGVPQHNTDYCDDKDNEPSNNSLDTTKADLTNKGQGIIPDWEICYPGDVDIFFITLEEGEKLVVNVIFKNDDGDLDAALLGPDKKVIEASRTIDDTETLQLPFSHAKGRYYIAVFGFRGATNKYALEISRPK